MARPCTVCKHPQRQEIDSGLAQGELSEIQVSRQYGLNKASVHRHRTEHTPKMLKTFASRLQVVEADQILAQIVTLYERCLTNLAEAEAFSHDSDKAKAVPALIRETRATLGDLAKVSLALADRTPDEVVVVENTLQKDIEEALRRRREKQAQKQLEAAKVLTPDGNAGARDALVDGQPGTSSSSGARDADSGAHGA